MSVVLSLMILFSPLDSDRGSTVQVDERSRVCIGEEIVEPGVKPPGFGEIERRQEPSTRMRSARAPWAVDTLTFDLDLWPISQTILTVCDGDLEVVEEPSFNLTTLARNAVDYAPDWLEIALTDNFHNLDSTYQDVYADMILYPTDPDFADEIAYQVARVSPEILMDSTFDPELIEVNAELLYEIDDSIHYADLVDYGAPPGGDYYTTVAYRVLEEGDTVEYEVPREIYYDYVVHPELSDESPRMDGYVYDMFWREYLFYEADSTYPVLCDYLKQAEVVWEVSEDPLVLAAGRPFEPENVALDVIGNWASRTVPFGASGNRPIQPNVIAGEHNGNCGELQDLVAAAGRCGFIPFNSVFTLAEDHVWCEFWAREWLEYQVDLGFGVTHINDPRTGYDQQTGGSKNLSSVMEWRSDGWVDQCTARYSDICSLHVQVLDYRGLPVDGARVLLSTDAIYGGIGTSCWGFTDEYGRVDFELGDLVNIYAHVNTEIGDYPENPDEDIQIIAYTQKGAHYYKTFFITEFIPSPFATPWLEDTLVPQYVFDIDVNGTYSLLHGYARCRRNTGDDGFYHTYNEAGENPIVDGYLADSLEFQSYLSGLPFTVQELVLDTETIEGEWTFYEGEGRPYLLLSNRDALTTTTGVSGTVALGSAVYPVAEGEFSLNPVQISLHPNPFRTTVRLSLDQPQSELPRARVFDSSGRAVRTLRAPEGQEPRLVYTWDGRDETGSRVGNGVYFLELETETWRWTDKVLFCGGNGGAR
jgi:hypothetical protein